MRRIETMAQQRGMTCDRPNLSASRGGVTMIEAILVILVLSGAAIASLFLLDGNWVSNHTVKDVTINISQTLEACAKYRDHESMQRSYPTRTCQRSRTTGSHRRGRSTPWRAATECFLGK